MPASPPASETEDVTAGNGNAFAPHDHERCRRSVMDAVKDSCKSRGLRLTPPRECVLRALLEDHKAMTAYELLERLRAEGLGSQPPVAYRALDFLVANGFVHRIERVSAFVACTRGGGAHAAAFLVCRRCRSVAETCLQQVGGVMEDAAAEHDFVLERKVVEAVGLCGRCRDSIAEGPA